MRIALYTLLAIILCGSGVSAQNFESNIETLRGLESIFVEIDYLEPDIVEDGLKTEQIELDIGRKLRAAEIKILTREEWMRESGNPYLFISITSSKRETGLYAFNVEVSFIQAVLLFRDSTVMVSTNTWKVESIGSVGQDNMIDFVRDTVSDQVNVFINDYLSVNPR